MEELSYDINYLSDITPKETDYNPSTAPPTTKEQVDANELSTALHDIHVEPTDQKVTAIDLTYQDSEHVSAITEVETSDLSLTGHNTGTADIDHTAMSTQEPAAYTEEHEAYIEKPAAHKEEPAACLEEFAVFKEEPAVYTDQPTAYTKEPTTYKEEAVAHIEYNGQHPRACPIIERSTSTNSHAVMQTQCMNEKASTHSDIAEDTDNGV